MSPGDEKRVHGNVTLDVPYSDTKPKVNEHCSVDQITLLSLLYPAIG